MRAASSLHALAQTLRRRLDQMGSASPSEAARTADPDDDDEASADEARVIVEGSQAVREERKAVKEMLRRLDRDAADPALAVSKWPRLLDDCLAPNDIAPAAAASSWCSPSSPTPPTGWSAASRRPGSPPGATEAATAAGLVLGTAGLKLESHGAAEGSIVAQHPRPGEQVPAGTSVTVEVGEPRSAGEQQVTVTTFTSLRDDEGKREDIAALLRTITNTIDSGKATYVNLQMQIAADPESAAKIAQAAEEAEVQSNIT